MCFFLPASKNRFHGLLLASDRPVLLISNYPDIGNDENGREYCHVSILGFRS